MRKFLFRGRKPFTWVWIYGYVIASEEDGSCGITNDEDGFTDVDIDTVGEFSGRYDENGVPVFEGDIVKIKDVRAKPGEYDEFTGVVDFDSSSFCIRDGFMTHYRWMDYEITVIGNKFDNPELMEQIED